MRGMIERAMGQVSGGAREAGVVEGAEGLTTALRRLVDHSAYQADRIDEMGGRLEAQNRALEGQSVRLAALVRARKETSEGLSALAARIAMLEERAGAAEREAMALAAANRRLIRLLKSDAMAAQPGAEARPAKDAPGPVGISAPAPAGRPVPPAKPAPTAAAGSARTDARALGQALRALAAEKGEGAPETLAPPVPPAGFGMPRAS
ncbi:MAG: hypothetical protein AAFP17_04065 [Pseudomonadota bacterium]